MRIGHWIIGATLGLCMVGCGGKLDHASSQPTRLTAPWVELNLPMAGGVIGYSDADSVTITFSDAPRVRGDKVHEALVSAGWELQDDPSSGDIVHRIYGRDAQQIVVSAMSNGHGTLLSVSSL